MVCAQAENIEILTGTLMHITINYFRNKCHFPPTKQPAANLSSVRVRASVRACLCVCVSVCTYDCSAVCVCVCVLVCVNDERLISQRAGAHTSDRVSHV